MQRINSSSLSYHASKSYGFVTFLGRWAGTGYREELESRCSLFETEYKRMSEGDGVEIGGDWC
jgi:hypothetical protein